MMPYVRPAPGSRDKRSPRCRRLARVAAGDDTNIDRLDRHRGTATELPCPTVSRHGRLRNGDRRSEERTQKQRIVSESIQAKQGSCTRLLASRAESRRVAASVAETVSEVVWVPGYVGL